MTQFNRWNRILGWLVFAVALITYVSTMEKTGSLWDCGEFLSCTYKLQVAHPPGAPFYMMVGKVFSLLAFGDTTKLAMMINLLSALSTAFCTLFFYWSSVMIMKIAFKPSEEELAGSNGKFILFSSFIAACAATFLDSMWFNAVEGEVYAFSVFFMAFNVWAILKWNEDNSEKADYWLLLIGACTGMSIGVHLLSLLVFPIITLIYYFKKFKPNWKGALISFIVGIALIQFVMKGVLSMTSSFLGRMDLFFVNTVGLPFHYGSIIGIFVIIGLFYYLIKKSTENRNFLKWSESRFKIPLNTLILIFAFLWTGYASYFMVVIRASANPPINMNVPNNFITLKSYIDREQYGDRPLLSGPNYNDLGEVEAVEDKSDIYVRNDKTGKYDLVGTNKRYVYPSRVKKLLPRLGHEDKRDYYRMWINPSFEVIDRSTNQVVQTFEPGQSEQAEQFAQQQNASGQPGQYVVKDKLTFFDNIKYMLKYQIGFMYFRYMMWNTAGRVDDLQGRPNNDYGRWTSGIPVIDNFLTDWWGNTNLDQTAKPEFLAKNRSNNRFYMIPFILCILGLIYSFKKEKESFFIILLLVFATGVMQVVFHNEPPVEPRERDYVYSPSYWSLLFWMPFGAYFIYDFLKKKLSELPAFYGALALCATAPLLMGTQGWDDHNRGGRTTTLAFARDMLNSCPPNAILFSYGDNDTYPLWYASEVEGIRPDIRIINTSLIEGDAYISQLRLPMNGSAPVKLSFPQDKVQGEKRQYLRSSPNPLSEDTLSVQEYMEFVMSDDQRTKVTYQNGISENFLPTSHVYLDIDPARALASKFLVTPDKINMIPRRINFDLPGTMTRGSLVQLDVIASNMYDRPICFASSNPSVSGLGIKNYLQNQGMIVMFTPTGFSTVQGLDAMDVENVYKQVMKYDFGNVKNHVLLDEHTMIGMYNIKQSIASLALQYAVYGKMDTANKLIDYMYANMPMNVIEANYIDLGALQTVTITKNAKWIKTISEAVFKNSSSALDWLTNKNNAKNASPYQEEVRNNLSTLNSLKDMLQRNGDTALVKRISEKFNNYEAVLQIKLNEDNTVTGTPGM
jgi:hypothetical protein